MEKIYKQLLNYIDVYECNGSGWILHSLQSLETVEWSLDPLLASVHHKLPAWIVSKRAVTNVKIPVFECFKWAFLAGMHPIKGDPSRLSKYQQFQGLYGSNTYSVSLKDIDRFCRVNNCSFNVYGIADGERDGKVNEVDGEQDIIGIIYPLKVAQSKPTTLHVNLHRTEKNETYHYSTMKNFIRLVRSQVTRNKHHPCLHGFSREDLLASHVQHCKTENAQRTEMPVDDPSLKSTNLQK